MVFRPKIGTEKTRTSARRIFAVGDVHGCARELRALLAKLNPGVDDLVVFLGDYIDRGPDSKGVIDLILELSRKCQVVALKGNHEAMFLDFLERPDSQGAGMFVFNGGAATLASYTGEDDVTYDIPDDHLSFLRGLQLYFETETHFFVHAGVPVGPLRDLDLSAPETELQLLWTRQPFLSSAYAWEKIIVHGHTPQAHVEMLPNRINLDTGCVYGNSLSALELPGNVLHSVERGVRDEAGVKLGTDLGAQLKETGDRLTRRFSGHLPVRAVLLNGRKVEVEHRYETLNFNQLGLLMRDLDEDRTQDLHVGDTLEGEIGVVTQGSTAANVVKFAGTVVRIDARGEYILYALRVEKIAGGVWGPDWVERPAS